MSEVPISEINPCILLQETLEPTRDTISLYLLTMRSTLSLGISIRELSASNEIFNVFHKGDDLKARFSVEQSKIERFHRHKLKIGGDIDRDFRRLKLFRDVIGSVKSCWRL